MSGIFSPSQAAEQSGFSLDTLRYYERIGLVDAIDRAQRAPPFRARRNHLQEKIDWYRSQSPGPGQPVSAW
jgi:hypothetical protein